jgi:murein DD-endopeptidase MepM/ murein hydrolase activator NlpD
MKSFRLFPFGFIFVYSFFMGCAFFTGDSLRFHKIADNLFEKGNYQGAIEAYKKTLVQDPAYPVLYNNLGCAYYYAGDYENALKYFNRALELGSDDPVFEANRLSLQFLLNKKPKKIATRQLLLDPDRFSEELFMALRQYPVDLALGISILEHTGPFDETSEKICDSCSGFFPLSVESAQKFGLFVADEDSLESTAHDPFRDERYHPILGTGASMAFLNELIENNDGNIDRALKEFLKGCCPDSLLEKRVKEIISTARTYRNYRYYSLRQYRKFWELCEEIFDWWVNALSDRYGLNLALDHHSGYNDSFIVRIERKLSDLEVSLPEQTVLWNNSAVIAQYLGDKEKAFSMMDSVLHLDRKNPEFLRNAGLIQYYFGNLELASQYLLRALEFDSSDVTIWTAMAELAILEKRYAFAKKILEEAIAIEPSSAQAQNDMGVLLVLEGNASQAVECFKKALEVQPQSYWILNNLGVALFLSHQREKLASLFDVGVSAVDTLQYLSGIIAEQDTSDFPDFHRPCDAPLNSPYGWRPRFGSFTRWSFHRGIDLDGETGDPVYAIADGRVKVAGSYLSGYGKTILLEHYNVGGKLYRSLYAHLSRILVKKGEFVKKGQIIGEIGATGRVTGSHLHFELFRYENGQEIRLDPEPYVLPFRKEKAYVEASEK